MNLNREVLIQSVIFGNPDYYPPMLNGSEILHQEDIHQEILCSAFVSDHFPPIEAVYPRSTRVKRLGANSSQSWRNYFSFLWHVWKHSTSTATCVIGYDLYGFFAARLVAWRYRLPLIYHIHDYSQWSSLTTFAQKVAKSFEQAFAQTATLVIVPDAGRAEVVRKELRLRKSPLVVANAALTEPQGEQTALSQALVARNRSFTKILWRQGMIGSGQGLVATIESIPLWSDRNWGFVIMGPGDEDYKVMLNQLAHDLGVAQQFVILPSVVFRDVSAYTVGAHLGHAVYEDTHVNNRYMSTASNKTMEYIAAGLPVLLSDNRANRSLIERYKNGVVVDNAVPESIASGVNYILANTLAASHMSAGSRRAFREEFNYAQQYAPVVRIFRQMAGVS